ncbi:tRNA lysidine(34) synthetase TilS [Qipengyuania vesicularis]|uniref:tRNA lysidine(34) synthetase TilS n=1 Tax=Qipengyuania vesicularis TaxID=2867232 RepID=UPI001C868784|nr:tRNA lysidine(34) synthetase TilS [Qipengyuania vesicularis]MBX7527607.1 tRNA lysidine(34) synthetase TilS [Qipengyuania vesicularis]
MAVAPELVERFRADLTALWLDIDEPDVKLGVALSGGPDSLALLLLAHAALPGRVEAATVDHGLRPESANEASQAAAICEALAIPHAVLRVTVAPGNLQSEARLARHRALADWAEERGVETLCTAHHREDQVETMLMRLNRGSGLSGLAGIRPAGLAPESDLVVLRPLLSWSRATLEQVVEASEFEAVQDPSNADRAYDRVRMRQALANADWIDRDCVARSAQVLADMEDCILGLAAEDLDLAGEFSDERVSYRPLERSAVYRPSIWAEVILQVFEHLDRTISRSDAVRMAESLMDGQPLNVGGVHASTRGTDRETVWTFAPENPRRTG